MQRQMSCAEARRPVDSHIDGRGAIPAPRPSFVSDIARVIGLFGKQRFMRLSLLRFLIEGLPQSAAVSLVTRALKPQGIVGALPDGSVGFLYLGPRGKGMVADLALVHHIRQQLSNEIHRQSPFKDVRLASLSVAHRWADEVTDAQDMVDALHQSNIASLQAS